MGRALPIVIAVLLAGAAHAREIGRVDLSFHGDRFMRDMPVHGRLPEIAVKTVGNDVFCRSITATGANGRATEIFQGLLKQNQVADIAVNRPGGVQYLTFMCGSQGTEGATLHVMADAGSPARPAASAP